MYKLQSFSIRVMWGSLYTSDLRIIENPCILLDGDAVLKYGNFEMVNDYFNKAIRAFSEIGEDVSKIGLIRFDKYANPDFTIKDICYILRRCLEFSSTGFAENLRAKFGTTEFLEWLRSEQNNVPLEVEVI